MSPQCWGILFRSRCQKWFGKGVQNQHASKVLGFRSCSLCLAIEGRKTASTGVGAATGESFGQRGGRWTGEWIATLLWINNK